MVTTKYVVRKESVEKRMRNKIISRETYPRKWASLEIKNTVEEAAITSSLGEQN